MYITKRGVASIMKNTSPHCPLLVGKEGGHTSLYPPCESPVHGHICLLSVSEESANIGGAGQGSWRIRSAYLWGSF
jgi:hypothetical protein